MIHLHRILGPDPHMPLKVLLISSPTVGVCVFKKSNRCPYMYFYHISKWIVCRKEDLQLYFCSL